MSSNYALGRFENLASENYRPRGAKSNGGHLVVLRPNHTATSLPDNGGGTYGDVGKRRVTD